MTVEYIASLTQSRSTVPRLTVQTWQRPYNCSLTLTHSFTVSDEHDTLQVHQNIWYDCDTMEWRFLAQCEQPSMHDNVNELALRDSKYMVHIIELIYETQASVELQYWLASCRCFCEKYLTSNETGNMRSEQPEQQHCLYNSGWEDLMRTVLNVLIQLWGSRGCWCWTLITIPCLLQVVPKKIHHKRID